MTLKQGKAGRGCFFYPRPTNWNCNKISWLQFSDVNKSADHCPADEKSIHFRNIFDIIVMYLWQKNVLFCLVSMYLNYLKYCRSDKEKEKNKNISSAWNLMVSWIHLLSLEKVKPHEKTVVFISTRRANRFSVLGYLGWVGSQMLLHVFQMREVCWWCFINNTNPHVAFACQPTVLLCAHWRRSRLIPLCLRGNKGHHSLTEFDMEYQFMFYLGQLL